MCKSSTELAERIEGLQAELRALYERLDRLEGIAKTNGTANGHATPQPVTTEPQSEPISEEIVLLISAAVAAYLGERPHIRQIRLISSHAWAAQGRVSIQASHLLHH
jgi:methylmalonyl-CoA carboxyltransferase large subunit